MNLLLASSSRPFGTPALGALVALIGLAAGCGADPAAELDASSREDAEVDAATMPPDLEVAWIRTRQREGGPSYDLAPDPRGGWLAFQPHAEHQLRVVGDAVVFGDPVAPAQLRVGAIGRTVGAEVPSFEAVAPADVTVTGNRAARAFGGSEVWYLNGPLGLEQGLTLDHRTAGEGVLVVRVDVSGGAVVPLGESGEADSDSRTVREVEVRSGNVTVRYHTIFATDATGARLPAHLETRGETIELHVDDTDATYPLEIDPLIVTVQKLVSPDAATSDLAGFPVAISGDFALFGAYGDDDKGSFAGAAYLFRRVTGVWTQYAKLLAPDGATGDLFGLSVAITGSYLAVAAPYDDASKGGVYVWRWTGSAWVYDTKIVPATAAAGDLTGFSVGIDASTLVIGAATDDETPGTDCGSVYVFTRGTSWTQQAKLLPPGLAAGDQLGYSVSVSGDRLVAGAPVDDASTGAVYAYSRSGTTWTAAASALRASDFAIGDRFGDAVSISGTSVLIGAPYNDDTATDSGSAYVFVFGTAWTQQRKFVASDPVASRLFGISVGISGNDAVIGGNATTNGAYVSLRTGTTWPASVTKILGSDTAFGDVFGRAVAVAGTTLLVGAPFDDWGTSVTIDGGSAYAFIYGTSWTQQARLVATDGSHLDQLGRSIDIDGTTAIVGAPGDDDAGSDAGAAYVFVKSGGVWTLQQKIRPSGGTTTENFGYDVAVSGDVVVIGAPYADDTATESGAVYVYTRSAGVWTQTLRLKLAAAAADDYFGFSVAIDGNTFAASAYADNNARGANAGTIVAYDKFSGAWALRSTLIAADGAADDGLGYSLALEGDRLVAGAPFDDDGGLNGGVLFVYSRASYGSTWAQLAKIVPTDAARASDYVGIDVAYSGGLLLAGALGDGQVAAGAGAVFVFAGPTTFTQQAKITAGDGAANDAFGISVSISGTTALIGASGDDANRGSAYAYRLIGGTWTFLPSKLVASDGATNNYFGTAVAIAGRDALVGAYFAASPDHRGGAAYAHDISGSNGDTCGSAIHCNTGFCVDGFCCNAACGGSVTNDCQACSTAAGAAVNGTCGSLSAAVAPTVVCRASGGICDIADVCATGNTSCPTDAKATTGVQCRASVDLCDAPDNCDGTNNACPADLKRAVGYPCRTAASACDKPELCTGGDACPANANYVLGDNFPCRMAVGGGCDVAEICVGDATCPIDTFAFGNVCRMPMGVCDIAETCAGTSAACPADSFAPASTECRAVAGICDVAERCTGSSAACPANAFVSLASATTCRAIAGDCDIVEQCSGTSAMCPTDALRNSAHVCRAALPPPTCDQAESCTGSSVNCPADVALPMGPVPCGTAGTGCDAADFCDGISLSCTDDTVSSTCEQQNVSIGPGRYHTCAVRANGKLYCWGDNTFGQLGVGSLTVASSLLPVQVGTATTWKTVTSGAFHSCATTTTAQVFCWGRNDRGQASVNPSTSLNVLSPIASTATGTSLALGDFHSCALTAAGATSCWGGNAFGQLGRASTADSHVPSGLIDSMNGTFTVAFTQIAAGSNHTCGMTAAGVVWCWGSNGTGQIGANVSTSLSSTIPITVPGLPTPTLEKPTALAAGGPRTCVIYRGQRVMCWGSNAARRAGDTLGYSSTPLDMALTGVASITLGESHICTRELDGDVACWGDNSFGQLGDLTATSRWLLPASVVATTRDIVSLIAGPMQTCAVLLPVVGETVPPIVCWGRGEEGQLGVGNDLDRVRYSSTVDFGPAAWAPVSLGAGWNHACVARSDNSVSCWGDNQTGATSGGTDTTYVPTVLMPPSITGNVRAYGGDGFSCAIGVGEGAACWGRNEYGQLGNPTFTLNVNRVPTTVPGLTAISSFSAGGSHACAIGTMSGMTGVWCWGANGQGQLGDGTLTDRRTPVRAMLSLSVGESVLEVGAGEAHTCVMTTSGSQADGRVFCWGRNAEGQIGDSTFSGDSITVPPPPDVDMGVPTMPLTASRLTPRAVFGLSTAAGLVAGRRHTCVTMLSGATPQVRCWGLNEHGQLGNNTRVNAPAPVVSTNIGNVVDTQLSAGGAHTCFFGSHDGIAAPSLRCWGRNHASQLGNHIPAPDALLPVIVQATQATNILGVVTGLDFTCVAVSQSEGPPYAIRCWGANEYAQTGNAGFRANRVAPVTVPVP